MEKLNDLEKTQQTSLTSLTAALKEINETLQKQAPDEDDRSK